MLLVCPSCRTRYVVADSAIGPAGRQVRCANCRHSWFQDGPKSVAPPQLDTPPAQTAATATPPPTAEREAEAVSTPVTAPQTTPSSSDPSPGFAVFDRPPVVAPSAPMAEPPTVPIASYGDDLPDDRSQFAHEPPFKPRRNPAKLMTYAAVTFALFVALAGGALWYSGWLSGSMGLSLQEPDLKIVLHDNLEQGRAADGTPYFIASGTIVNPTAERQNVPDMLVTLKDSNGRSVYNWKMRAPVKSLAPGATADFSQLRRDVPLAATRISIVWALAAK